jgi:hypothetical protein
MFSSHHHITKHHTRKGKLQDEQEYITDIRWQPVDIATEKVT